jgi:hypothetical protein
MPDELRTYAMERLHELGEFDSDSMDTSTTQYERTQALKNGLPATFVEKRRREIRDNRWKVRLFVLGAVLNVVLLPTLLLGIASGGSLSDLASLSPWTLTAFVGFGLAVGLFSAAYRIRDYATHARRAEMYDLLAATRGENRNADTRSQRAPEGAGLAH